MSHYLHVYYALAHLLIFFMIYIYVHGIYKNNTAILLKFTCLHSRTRTKTKRRTSRQQTASWKTSFLLKSMLEIGALIKFCKHRVKCTFVSPQIVQFKTNCMVKLDTCILCNINPAVNLSILNFISYTCTITLYGKGHTAFRVCMKKDPQLTLGSI